MKNTFLFMVMICLTITTSLTAQDQVTTPSKMEQVMESHDVVMDKMPKISRLINKLQTKANASYEKKQYEDAIADLKNANKSMMTWMENFGKRFDADEMLRGKTLTETKQKWLLEEEKNVADLDEEIELSIAQAEAALIN